MRPGLPVFMPVMEVSLSRTDTVLSMILNTFVHDLTVYDHKANNSLLITKEAGGFDEYI